MHDDVAWLYRQAGAEGLIVGSSGNVSGRMPDGTPNGTPNGTPGGMMVITPSGADPSGDPGLVAIAMDGTVQGTGTPSSEWAMHAAIYRVCPNAEFIIHTHADACTALACLGSGLPPFHYMVVMFGGDGIRCAPYETFGTPALAEVAAEAIRGRTACLLANHGMVVAETSARRALDRARLLETLCRQYLLARSAGEPRLLTPDQIRNAQQRFVTYGSSTP